MNNKEDKELKERELEDEELAMIAGGLWPFAMKKAEIPTNSQEKEDKS